MLTALKQTVQTRLKSAADVWGGTSRAGCRQSCCSPQEGSRHSRGGQGGWDASGSTHPPCTPAGSTACLQRPTPAAREPWRYLRPRHPVWQSLICARHVMPQPGAREPACRVTRVAVMSSQKLSITWVPGQRREAESSAAAGVQELALRGVSRHWDLWGGQGDLSPTPRTPQVELSRLVGARGHLGDNSIPLAQLLLATNSPRAGWGDAWINMFSCGQTVLAFKP